MGTYKCTVSQRNSGVLHITGHLDQESTLGPPNRPYPNQDMSLDFKDHLQLVQ